MNSVLLKENKTLKEKYYYKTLKSGLKIILIPKDFPNLTAFVCCDFGNADLEYELDGKKYSLPSGTAHFLEHKMFETKDGSDAFLQFDDYGGNANAFTSFENTCYYFSCTENFKENLSVLLSAVSSFHCTEQSVEKERMIISREIMMYEDSPASNVTRNLYKGLYHNHPITNSISGTIEDISQITKETLTRAYNHFYTPENLCLCVCGNMDMEEISEIAEKYFPEKSSPRPKTLFPDEPKEVKTNCVFSKGIVAAPLFSIGIKCPPPQKNDLATLRKGSALRLAVSLLFGRASDFYCNNYKKGLLNERFYAGYMTSRNNGNIVISGTGNSYEEVLKSVVDEIQAKKENFFSEEQFLREKKAAYAESITLFDSGEDLAATVASCGFLEYDEFDAIEVLKDIKYEEVKEALNSIDTNNISISIIGE